MQFVRRLFRASLARATRDGALTRLIVDERCGGLRFLAWRPRHGKRSPPDHDCGSFCNVALASSYPRKLLLLLSACCRFSRAEITLPFL